ncbi:hypothetical protein L226DRAFT_535256 [Lentinus tigrinus ALCF2SS1-7]|uniref:MYND-type domain-containing protein n=1 Tax=Lentinus tigrinus ALCF2SS1-6 TaxID=1328759 RepID=A0A5C2SDU4_9APHY|nr:hypothetical protein L227DRAFT_573754 [Lentinus tigrinus ALCF2SS1-6]RPD74376.1 hypothetical protein L226DRAFT_535256 [Lentinus tigrinus ALCF2SS1-7]
MNRHDYSDYTDDEDDLGSESSWGSDIPWDAKPAVDPKTARKAWKELSSGRILFLEHEYELCVPCFERALEDPDNIEYILRMVKYFPDKSLAMTLLDKIRDTGRRYLIKGMGEDCFDDNSQYFGQFECIWGAERYLRTLLAIAQVAIEGGDLNKGIEASSESLRVSYDDEIGQRHMLGTLLLKAGRYEDALGLCRVWLDPNWDRYPRVRIHWNKQTYILEPLNDKIVEYQRKGSGAACELFNAALAAFRLKGDCELARQCLRLGAEICPLIMTRLLGRMKRPHKRYRRTRDMNRHEDAHDYCWLAQDIWMENDVWNWANGDSEVRKLILRKCAGHCKVCETNPLQFKQCSGCREAYYCSTSCQRKHWPQHKPVCRARVKDMQTRSPPLYNFLDPGPDYSREKSFYSPRPMWPNYPWKMPV